MVVYHYSKAVHLDKILESGVLLPTAIDVPSNEKPAVWFTKNPVWEPTSGLHAVGHHGRFVRSCDMQESHKLVGLIRFAVDEKSAPYNWRHHKERSGIDRAKARALHDAALRQGSNPAEYRISYEPVPASEWLAVEKWDGQRWQPLPYVAKEHSDEWQPVTFTFDFAA